MSDDEWRESTDPDELAAAVAAQARVEAGRGDGWWVADADTADEFRASMWAGTRYRVPRRWKLAGEELVDGGGATEAERYARARCDALLAELAGALAERDELAAQLAQVPEVPDGHELVVLSTETVDYYGENDPTDYEPGSVIYRMITAARAAIARRPKPEPRTERVPVWDAMRDGRAAVTPDGGTMDLGTESVLLYLSGTVGRIMYDDASWPVDKRPIVAPDGTVEVLRDGAR